MPPILVVPKQNVVWQPLPGSQTIALDSRANDTLLTGTRGSGKTEVQLFRFRRRVGIGYGSFWRGILLDREYKHLDEIVTRAKRWFLKFADGAKFQESTNSYKWMWKTGEEFLLRQAKKISDYENYHGQEFPSINWNEITKYPTSELFDQMLSCNRSSWTLEKDGPRDAEGNIIWIPDIPLETFSTTNSYGPGHNWVKGKWIDVAPYGKVVRVTVKAFNPRTQKIEDVTRTQVAIFSSFKENIFLDPVYIATLMQNSNEAQRRSWLFGDWDIVAGGAFDDVWDRSIHIVPRFKVPANWYVDRSLDWGSSHPYSVGWWAEANGEEIEIPTEDGLIKWCPERGSLIRINELYGSEKIGTNLGIRKAAGDVAKEIKATEIKMINDGWLNCQPWPGPADNQIRDVRESDVETIEKKMASYGIRWRESDKSNGSRRNGLELVRQRMLNAKRGEGPGIYVMDNCTVFKATVPILPRDEDKLDDVDTEAEDHCYDEVRYRVLAGNNRIARTITVTQPH